MGHLHKIFLLACAILCTRFLCYAQITLPYGESFESGLGDWSNVGGDDFDWTRDGNGTPSNNTGPSDAHDGSFYMYTEASNPNFNDVAFFDATFDFTSATAPQFSFYYHMYGSGMGTLRVLVDGTQEFTITGQQHTSGTEAWTQQQIDLTSYAGSTVTIRFEMTTTNNFRGDAAIDYISCVDPCSVNPGNASVDDATLCATGSTTLNLSGQDGGTSIQWQSSTDNVAFSDISGATSASSSSGTLTAGNTYYFRAAVTNGCTSYSDTVSTQVLSSSGSIVPPYTESFESDMGSWQQSTSDDFNWTRNNGETYTLSTGPWGASDGTFYIYTESSNPNYNDDAIIYADFDFTGLTAPEVEFDYHMYGSDMGTLRVRVNGNEEWIRTGQQHTNENDAWTTATVDLTAYAGDCYVLIEFYMATGASFRGDAAVDNIKVQDNCEVDAGTASVSDAAICAAGTVDLSLSGQDAGTTIQWQQSTDDVSFSDISGATSANETTGTLSTGNTYYFRAEVTNGCSSYTESVSTVVNAGNGANSVPEAEDLESGFGNWTNSTSDDFNWTRASGSTPTGSTGPSVASSGVTYAYTEANGNTASSAILEADFDFSTISDATLTFDYHMYGTEMGSLRVLVNGEIVWTKLGQQNTSSADPWKSASIDLGAYAGDCYVFIQIEGVTGVANESDMAIDNIQIFEPCSVEGGTASISNNALCAAGTVNLSASGYDGGATLQWQESINGGAFSDLSGATSANETTGTLSTGNTYEYRLEVTNGCVSYSDTVSVIVNAGNGTNTPQQTESYESGFGIWSQSTSDDFNWSRTSGSTPSASTGPNAASDGTQYAFTEATSNANSTAILEADFDFTSVSNPVLEFDYHMYGATMGRLSVRVNGTEVWARNGQQQSSTSQAWIQANVDLSAYAGECYALIQIVGETGIEYYGNDYSDMAIDNMNVEDQCTVNPGDASISTTSLCAAGTVDLSIAGQDGGTTLQWQESTDNITYSDISGATSANHTTSTLSVGNTYYYRCAVTNGCTEHTDTVSVIVNSGNGTNTTPQSDDFETDFGIWSQSTSDDFDWTRQTGGTPTGSTGPNAASTGSYYVFTESTGNDNSTAILEADFDFTSVSNPSISFDYHMYGAETGILRLMVNGLEAWSMEGQQHASSTEPWTSVSVDLSAYGGACYALVQFRVETDINGTSDIGIDNIQFDAPEYTWTGTTNTNWTTATNWSGGVVPNNLANVTIPDVSGASGNDPVIGSSSTGQAQDVTIEAGGSLSISTGGELEVYGDFTTAEAQNLGAGAISFLGTASQSISGTITYTDVTVNNGNGVAVSSGSASVSGVVSLVNGNFNTNNALTLTSDASNTGSIGEITGGSITGNVTVQRYWDKTASGYVNIATCINSMTLSDWDDDMWTTGFTGSDVPSNPFNNVYTYDETQLDTMDNGFVGATNITNSVGVGTGFLVYVTADPHTLDVTGTVHTGNYNFTVSYTDDPAQPATEDGWNLLGNPYPSAIDWDAAGWTKSNLNNAVYVYDDENDQYAAYVDGVGSNGGSRYIASSQSFWVQANASSPSLAITESCKSNSDPTFFRSAAPTLLRLEVEGSNGLVDEAIVRLDSSATIAFDKSKDALKLASWSANTPSISTFGEHDETFTINTFNRQSSGHEIPLKVTVGVTGTYTMSFTQNTLGESKVYLEDLEEETITDINSSSDYTFDINASYTGTRFLLHIGRTPPQALPIELVSFDAELSNGVVDLIWITESEENNEFFTIERSDDGVRFEEILTQKAVGNSNERVVYVDTDPEPLLGVSYYKLKQTDRDGKYTYSQVVSVNNTKQQSSEINMWPNPNTGDSFFVEYKGVSGSEEVNIAILDITGRVVYTEQMISDENGYILRGVNPQSNLPMGSYTVTFATEQHVESMKMIVK